MDGEQLQGVHSFSVDNNGFFQADTFRLTLILSAQATGRDFAWWSQQTDIQIELMAGYPADAENYSRGDLTSLIVGYADDIEIDPVANTISIIGRDLTSKMIDTKRSITFQEQISSGIVAQIASAVGLEADIVPTKTTQGAFYEIMHRMVNSNVTYWDIVTRLAQFEQYSAWVTGRTLHFRPRAESSATPFNIEYHPPSGDRYVPVSNAKHLRFSHNLSIARDIKVTVYSYSTKSKRAIKAVAQKKRVRNTVTYSIDHQKQAPQEYVYSIPDLTADQAQAKANAKLRELSQHEMVLTFDMPADDVLTAQTPIKVIGTGTAFDQEYWPSSIVRSFGIDEGYTMSGTAKNQAPDAEYFES